MFRLSVHLENFEITEVSSNKVLDSFLCEFINKRNNLVKENLLIKLKKL